MRKRRLTVHHWYEPSAVYWCAICNTEIVHSGLDPLRVMVDPARTPSAEMGGPWVLWAHALCLRDKLDRDFAHEIPSDWFEGNEPPTGRR
jgi:hypothetical protein